MLFTLCSQEFFFAKAIRSLKSVSESSAYACSQACTKCSLLHLYNNPFSKFQSRIAGILVTTQGLPNARYSHILLGVPPLFTFFSLYGAMQTSTSAKYWCSSLPFFVPTKTALLFPAYRF